jgi:hypothetical protein
VSPNFPKRQLADVALLRINRDRQLEIRQQQSSKLVYCLQVRCEKRLRKHASILEHTAGAIIVNLILVQYYYERLHENTINEHMLVVKWQSVDGNQELLSTT